MEKLVENFENQEGNYDYGVDSEGIVEAFLIFVGIILLGTFISGMVLCGCCIGSAYLINKYCLQANTVDANNPYRDDPVELKEVTIGFDNSGKNIDDTHDNLKYFLRYRFYSSVYK